MPRKSTKQETAKQAYKKSQKKIAAMIKRIQKRLEEHGDDKEIHWGHVGDLGYVKEQLGIIDQFFANED